ncbi:hypothetical protein X805_04910 [Sphaerotilus natans subsp. natans DSM 6575]|uniref:Uncharacterized protein n=1 Tax=Sphaerotilus natans subsp. natans DSM 6575 TaxID=1286631 RepID=A0A059KR25_9BURK|nr:hypothetical protein [Sphaerotilus natans]KDB53937.1 hypothetical protein X805_04910 [Sphaerotilus natans subsp. natans DSM 6575]SIR67847.1 hypothetical protein SAMN05421778_11467 [Sphaerotilus natans]
MPRITDSPSLPLPLQPTDRVYVERAGQGPYEIPISEIQSLIGAAPADHTHSPESLGAADADHTHSAAQIAGLGPVATMTLAEAQASVSGGGVYAPTMPTTEAIAAAAARAAADGGGIVQLPAGRITLTASLPAISGVRYRGVHPVPYVSAAAPDAYTAFIGGTVLEGNGTFAAYGCNMDDAVSPLASTAAFNAMAVFGAGFENCGFENFTYAVKGGANYKSSFINSAFSNLYALNCTAWGFYFENFIECSFDNLQSMRATLGIAAFIGSASNAVLSPGNSTLTRLYGEPASTNGSRGIMIAARNGTTLNEIGGRKLQVNRFVGGERQELIQGTSITIGSPIPVTDTSYYPLEMPVCVTQSTNGFTFYSTYFVYSRSTTTGPGTITLSRKVRSSGDIIYPNASNTMTLTTKGFPNLELVSEPSSSIANFNIIDVDLEGNATTAVVLQGVAGHLGINQVPGTTQAYNTVCMRSACACTIDLINHGGYWDIDSAAGGLSYLRTSIVSGFRQNFGINGSWRDESGNWVQQFAGTAPQNGVSPSVGDFIVPAGTRWMKAGKLGIGRRVTNSNAASLTLSDVNVGEVVNRYSAGTATWTLPTAAAANLGMAFRVVNASSQALTVATGGGQLVNGKPAATSIAVSAYSSCDISLTYDGASYLVSLGGVAGTVTY